MHAPMMAGTHRLKLRDATSDTDSMLNLVTSGNEYTRPMIPDVDRNRPLKCFLRP